MERETRAPGRSGVARGGGGGGSGGGGGGGGGFALLRCYVLLGCRVKKGNIGVLKKSILTIVRFLTSLRWFVNPVVYGITSRRNRPIVSVVNLLRKKEKSVLFL